MKQRLNPRMRWLSLVLALLCYPALVYGAEIPVTLADKLAHYVVFLLGTTAGTLVLARGRVPLKRRLVYAFLINFATITLQPLAWLSRWGWLIVKALAPDCADHLSYLTLEWLLCEAFYWVCWNDLPEIGIMRLKLDLGFAVALTALEYLAARVFLVLSRIVRERLRPPRG